MTLTGLDNNFFGLLKIMITVLFHDIFIYQNQVNLQECVKLEIERLKRLCAVDSAIQLLKKSSLQFAHGPGFFDII